MIREDRPYLKPGINYPADIEKKVPAREHEHSFVRQKLGSDHEVKGVAGFPTWQCECGEKIKAS